jgi:hypothetical protein
VTGGPAPSAGPSANTSTRAVAALVCALAGLICCPVTSPLAWWLGWSEVRAVRRGASTADDSTLAAISMWLGVLGTALGLILLVALLVVGGATILLLLLRS